MYWYPFSNQEEERAWNQAEAQAEDAGSGEGLGQMKFVGNLGELVVEQFLSEYADDRKWEYYHAEAIKKGEPEYGDVDFRVGPNSVDIKSSTDIRKLDPVEMYHSPSPEERPAPPSISSEGYPSVKVDDVDAFIFVLISKAKHDSLYQRRLTEAVKETENETAKENLQSTLEERSGDHVAAILGWMYSTEFSSDMRENYESGTKGKFTRMYLRDMYEFLLRSNAVTP